MNERTLHTPYTLNTNRKPPDTTTDTHQRQVRYLLVEHVGETDEVAELLEMLKHAGTQRGVAVDVFELGLVKREHPPQPVMGGRSQGQVAVYMRGEDAHILYDPVDDAVHLEHGRLQQQGHLYTDSGVQGLAFSA